jgi:hypothetical protein
VPATERRQGGLVSGLTKHGATLKKRGLSCPPAVLACFAEFQVSLQVTETIAHAVDGARSLLKMPPMNRTGLALLQRFAFWLRRRRLPAHLETGRLGERAAKKHLRRKGLKFLTANFRTERGEIDLVMRDEDCLQ